MSGQAEEDALRSIRVWWPLNSSQPPPAAHLLNKLPITASPPPPIPQNIGRSPPNTACASYLTSTEACEYAGGALATSPSSLTKWILEPAGGDAARFYVRMAVSAS